ncbi:RNA polymerase sigma-70 factor (ECF subfamily) [Pedobacter metabolipauper]|uniref:RNA polymerase sigma-70 factor (ECF subfamily) n=2 Tax=Pedobacter metabolipauper TaxID=425513 RepID=A0A4R6T2Z5_9SPHI|nr:RNA polymerase sigma-70 factor (ECF subfamily) [Pedobacter metabolipauper]
MQLVKEGDLDKMSLLFKRHYRALYGFLYHMTHDKGDSEDMVQNIFYRMLKYRRSYTGTGAFQTWMFHIARNVLKDRAKKRPPAPVSDKMDRLTENLSDGKTASDQLEKTQAQQELYRAMELLNDEAREILTLSKFQELKYQDIALILNIGEGTVKVRVHRAINELKNIYKKNRLL